MAADDQSSSTAPVCGEDAWSVLLQLAERAKTEQALTTRVGIGALGAIVGEAGAPILWIEPSSAKSWAWPGGGQGGTAEVEDMLDLYMPLCVGAQANRLVVGHLGTSLDGRIATHGGVSQFITGDENLLHAHRMRALFDAVIVGAKTAASDNPRLTTRLTSGKHPTRVLIDPRCCVASDSAIFTDGASETLVICDRDFLPAGSDRHIGLACVEGMISPRSIIDALAARGLKRLFIEGGGLTVSQFLSEGALDRLHVCVAPMIIGSGRPAFQLPEVDKLADGIFLEVRHFKSGRDLLFDCQFRQNE